MPSLPLAAKLRRAVHREVAEAQDLVVMATYDTFPQSVLHGGTAIWRCYGGNRFSEDVDFYLPPSARREAKNLSSRLKRSGLDERKFRATPTSLFAEYAFGGSAVRFEAVFKSPEGPTVRPYEMLDGAFAAVRTLSPEALIREKALAYLGRRKARDLYDIYILTHAAAPDRAARDAAASVLSRFAPPVDHGVLKTLIFLGSVPSVEEMKEEIALWAR